MDPSVTLWQYEWLQQGRSAATFKNMQRELGHFATWLERPLESATVADCLGYLSEKAQVSPSKAAWAWRALASYFKFTAALDGTANPMARVKCPKVPEPATQGVSPAQVKQLLLVCNDSPRDKALIALLACTGLRRSELANLLLEDVLTDQQTVLVRTSKSGKPRVVPMSTDATMLVLKYLRVRSRSPHAGMPWLWLGKKGRLTSDGVRLLLVRRCKQAGVDVSAHNFRRAFAVNWLAQGGSQVSLMSICGWSSPAMPARYTRHAASELAQAEYKRLIG